MIEETQGNLLEAPAEALVNTVNTVGVMGKGIALQFARAFPENLAAYKKACDAGEVRPGRMFITENRDLTGPRYIINFPTKRHWRGSSRIEDVADGLKALVEDLKRLGIRSVAVPPLGCGNGGLDWAEVRPLIEEAFASAPEVRVLLFPPSAAPDPAWMKIRTRRPRMAGATAAMVAILGRYAAFDYRLTLLEVHKLVYFLRAAGEPMKRTLFEKGPYGPYADSLRHVLNRLEGHFLSGWGDGTRNRPHTPVRLIPGAAQEAEAWLAEQAETKARIDRVARLIEGFETPAGLELLATVHWAAAECAAPVTLKKVSAAVAAWSPRKRALFPERLVKLAWNRLADTGFLQPA